MTTPDEIVERNVRYEESQLAPGETNWYKVLTSPNFIIRFAIVLAITIICTLIILNVTLDPNSKSWYNKLHKPDWMPDGVISAVIFAFASLLLAWVWYRLDEMTSGYTNWVVNIWIVIILVLQFVWVLMFYKNQNITAGKYLICFYLGFMALLFIFSLYYTRFSDISLYTMLYTGWLVMVLCYTFNVHNLDKEYKLLGLAKDTTSSLYMKKMKLEIVEGVKITEDGQKIEFNAEEQE